MRTSHPILPSAPCSPRDNHACSPPPSVCFSDVFFGYRTQIQLRNIHTTTSIGMCVPQNLHGLKCNLSCIIHIAWYSNYNLNTDVTILKICVGCWMLDVGLGAIHYAYYNIRALTQNHIFLPPEPSRTPNPSSNFGGETFSGRVHKT